MCQAKRGRKKSTADRGQSDMFQGGERNTLKLSGLAAASAEGRRLRGSFLHPGCLHHANWIRWISRLQDRKKSNWMLMQSRRRCSVFSHLRTNRPSSTSSVWQWDCTTWRTAPPRPRHRRGRGRRRAPAAVAVVVRVWFGDWNRIGELESDPGLGRAARVRFAYGRIFGLVLGAIRCAGTGRWTGCLTGSRRIWKAPLLSAQRVSLLCGAFFIFIFYSFFI